MFSILRFYQNFARNYKMDYKRDFPAGVDLKGGQGGAWTLLEFLHSLYIIEKL
jgi:hypothetical protein